MTSDTDREAGTPDGKTLDRSGWALETEWGPPLIPFPDQATFKKEMSDIAARLAYPVHRQLFDYWYTSAIEAGGIPVFDRKWWQNVGDVVLLAYVHEFVIERQQIRIRYAGQELERRGRYVHKPGETLAEVTQSTDAFVWASMRPIIEQAAIRFAYVNLAHLNQQYVRVSLLELPFVEEPGGHVRFSIGAWGLPET